MSGKIFWIGDSTVHFNRIDTFPQCGMGQVLELYLRPGVTVVDCGENGCSTKSFRDRGFFAPVEAAMGEGDILLIQFGHNDPKIEDPARYTTIEQYRQNLLDYARAARKAGALPVLVTPLTRRRFNGNKLTHSHGRYPAAVRELAAREGIPLIDLTTFSRALVEALGEGGSRSLFMIFAPGQYINYPQGMNDNTHLRYEGAVKFAGLVAQGLKNLGGPYAQVLLPEKKEEK